MCTNFYTQYTMRSSHIPVKYVLHSLCLTILLAQTSCMRTNSLQNDGKNPPSVFDSGYLDLTSPSFSTNQKKKHKKNIKRTINNRYCDQVLKKLKKIVKDDKIPFPILIASILECLDNTATGIHKEEKLQNTLGLNVNEESLHQLRKAKSHDPITKIMCDKFKKYLIPQNMKEKRKEKIARKKERIEKLLKTIFEDEDYENDVKQLGRSENNLHKKLHKRVMALVCPDDTKKATSSCEDVEEELVDGHSI